MLDNLLANIKLIEWLQQVITARQKTLNSSHGD